MGRRKRDTLPGHGKILDAWAPPVGAGEPVGCVATSFTFSPAFFEEECLSRFLQLQTDPDEDGSLYLVEREEKLAQVVCASALVDQHHCRGTRSLRWDLLPARVPRGVLHAKVSLLCWTQCVRLIVASANITEDGYRRNHEIFGVLEYHPEGEAPLPCLRQVGQFLLDAASDSQGDDEAESPALTRWTALIDRALSAARGWGLEEGEDTRAQVRVRSVLVGPDRPGAFESISAIWPGGSPPIYASVMSPFFDPPDAPNRPAEALWQNLRQRGKAEVSFYVESEEVPDEDTVFIHAPESLCDAEPSQRENVMTEFLAIELDEGRPFHAKGIWLEDDRWSVYMLGSSNFTSAGLGLGTAANIEANLAYVFDGERHPEAYKEMQDRFLGGDEIDIGWGVKWQPRTDAGEDADCDELLLPQAFGQATYGRRNEQKGQITFTFAGQTPRGWSLMADDREEVFFDESQWLAMGSLLRATRPWTVERPPSGFWVRWDGALGAAWWPVNVEDAASLPPPDELKDLALDVLVDILTSARPLHEAMRTHLRRRPSEGESEQQPVIDPHKRVDTSQFLLQRTRRVSYALNALRVRLERPVATEDCLEWRLRGPVGVMAVAKAVEREAHSDEEKAFLLSELALELARARPRSAPGCLPAKRVGEGVLHLLPEIRAHIPAGAIAGTGNLQTYIRRVFAAIQP